MELWQQWVPFYNVSCGTYDNNPDKGKAWAEYVTSSLQTIVCGLVVWPNQLVQGCHTHFNQVDTDKKHTIAEWLMDKFVNVFVFFLSVF